MIKTNEKKLVEYLMQCKPGMPMMFGGWAVDYKGKPFILPCIGGITTNIEVGDPAFGWEGDHIEPGVSAIINQDKRMDNPNKTFQKLVCVGDQATLISGKAKGSKGVVIGQHGGSEHAIIDFPKSVKEKMTYDDNIMIKCKGLGLKLSDHPDIKMFNLNPSLFKKMKIKELKGGKLQVPVTTMVPAQCMGSGVGCSDVASGDYDVMTSDEKTVKKFNLDKMRFGDFVAIMDHDNSYGRTYMQGAVSIGVVVHSDCFLAGHGPGITTVMTCPRSLINPVIDPKANIADLLKIGSAKKGK